MTAIDRTKRSPNQKEPEMLNHRITRMAALSVTVAAIAPASAFAGHQDLRSPDTRDAAAASTATQDLRSPDTRDAAAGRTTSDSPEIAVIKLSQPVPTSADGIDWSDVGLGAGAALPILLLVAGSFTLAHRHRSGRGHVAVS